MVKIIRDKFDYAYIILDILTENQISLDLRFIEL